MRHQRLIWLTNVAAVLVIVLVLAAGLLPLPTTAALILGTIGAFLATAVVGTWLTIGWLNRPRRPLWLVALWWVLLALLGAWMVGYALALRGDPSRFIDGRPDASPFGYGAWFGVLVLVTGGWHLHWLRRVRGSASPGRTRNGAGPR